MDKNVIASLFLPLALAFIMFGLGMTLALTDFKRIIVYPKAVLLGSFTQLVILPLAGFVVAFLMLRESPELAVGLVLLAACPGGPTANLFTHLGNGDIALSLTLTAISSCLKVFTIPLIVNFSLKSFMDVEKEFQLDIGHTILKIILFTLLPASLGMIVKAIVPRFANRAEKPLKLISALFLASVVIAAIVKERQAVIEFLERAGPAALVLNLLGITIGYFLPQFFRMSLKQKLTISIESSIQNGTLAITIASSPLMLNNTTMAMPAAVYSIIMFFTALSLIGILNRRRKNASKE